MPAQWAQVKIFIPTYIYRHQQLLPVRLYKEKVSTAKTTAMQYFIHTFQILRQNTSKLLI